MLVDTTDTNTYNIYRCIEDGVFTTKKDMEPNNLCPYCKKESEKYVER